MKKLLVLVLVLGFFSCSEQEDVYCNSSCWTVINKKDRMVGDNIYEFSIKIQRNCSTTNEWKRVYLNNTSELAMYELGDVLCGEQVPE
jgi:hypothetical protein